MAGIASEVFLLVLTKSNIALDIINPRSYLYYVYYMVRVQILFK